MSTTTPSQPETPPWWASFPQVQSSCETVSPEQVLHLLEQSSPPSSPSALDIEKKKKKTFLLVDVRQTDWQGGTIATSINLPAQSFYQTRAVTYQLCKQAGIDTIIFYCGSSNGRGPRSAGWMQDYLNEIGETEIKAVILKGGVKGWQKLYGGKWMDAYDDKFWAGRDK